MNADYLQLSDRRCRIRIGKTTFYVKTVEPPREAGEGWDGFADRRKGTYDVDDGTETRRVEAWNPTEAVYPDRSAPTVSTSNVTFAAAVVQPSLPWTDPRIVNVQPAPVMAGAPRRNYYHFKGGWTCLAPNEADAVAQYDGRNTP